MWDLTKEHDINVGVFVGVQGDTQLGKSDNDVKSGFTLTRAKPLIMIALPHLALRLLSAILEYYYSDEKFHDYVESSHF